MGRRPLLASPAPSPSPPPTSTPSQDSCAESAHTAAHAALSQGLLLPAVMSPGPGDLSQMEHRWGAKASV